LIDKDHGIASHSNQSQELCLQSDGGDMTQTQTQAKGDSLFRKKLKELVGPSNV